MDARSSVVLLALALFAYASATNVQQCAGRSIASLSEHVQLIPCKKLPCKLKKGTDEHILIKFTPEKDIKSLVNKVYAEIFSVSLPFFGVDGNSVCDKLFTESGDKAPCPLKAGNTYVYKDSFPVLEVYPNLNVKVHWALKANGKDDIMCFEVDARIAK